MIKRHEQITLPLINNFTIYVNINTIIDRLVFKIKTGYKLELQTPETIKYFTAQKKLKKLIDKKKNEENVPGCNFVNNQYQQKSEVL